MEGEVSEGMMTRMGGRKMRRDDNRRGRLCPGIVGVGSDSRDQVQGRASCDTERGIEALLESTALADLCENGEGGGWTYVSSLLGLLSRSLDWTRWLA